MTFIRRGRRRAAVVALIGAVAAGCCSAATTGATALPVLAAGHSAAPAATASSATCPWMNASQPAPQRAHEMIAAMTLTQKLMWLDEKNAYAFPADYPQFCLPSPDLKYTNGATGEEGNGSGVTAYPDSMAVAASFDPALARQEGSQRAEEAWLKGTNVILGPTVNLVRTPLFGRAYSTFGEDPYLSGLMGAAEVNGIQGNARYPVVAVVKHWDAYNQEQGRNNMNVAVSDRTLHDLYQLSFENVVRDSDPGGIMCAYPMVNGTYSCQNPSLNDVLKRQIDFPGFVVSDFFADHSTTASMNAGMDQELNIPRYYSVANLKAALGAGQITMAEVNAAVYRYLEPMFRVGVFDRQLPAAPAAVVSTAQHVSTAEQLGADGTVLLKNDGGTLPLPGPGKTIAVIGATASTTPTNGVSARNACAGNSISFGGRAPSGQVIDCSAVVSPLQGIRARAARAGDTVVYDNGAAPAEAASVAAKADYAVVLGYYGEGEGVDRASLSLDGDGNELISAVAAANPRTIVVLNTGGAVLMPWLGKVQAVLENWYGGQAVGTELAAVLFGDANPSGKLPVTFPTSASATPVGSSAAQYPGVSGSNGVLQVSYSEGSQIGYRWYDATGTRPLFPFGYGLSYTSFKERLLTVRPDPAGGANATVLVRNSGGRAGAQVVELYVQGPASADEPSRQLEASRRVTLPAHHAAVVTLHLTPWAFANWSATAGDWQVAAGRYQVQLGTSAVTVVGRQGLYLGPCAIPASATAASCPAGRGRAAGHGLTQFDSYNPVAPSSQYTAVITGADGISSPALVRPDGRGLFSVVPRSRQTGGQSARVTVSDKTFGDSVSLGPASRLPARAAGLPRR